MTDDHAPAGTTFAEREGASIRSVPSVVSLMILALFAGALLGVYSMVVRGVRPDPVALNLLLILLTSLVSSLGSVTGFWLASSYASVQSSARKDAVIAAATVAPVPVVDTPSGPAVQTTEAGA